VERHDQENGSITYEIWDYRPKTYRRLCSLNEWSDGGAEDDEERELSTAKDDAELIMRALNLDEAALTLSRFTTPPLPGSIVLNDETFDEALRILTEPSEPTEAIKRGAELLKQFYGKAKAAPPLPEDQVKKAAEIIANSPLIDAPKLPAECWQGLARSILKVCTTPLPDEIAGLVKQADDAAINTDDAEDRKLFANLGDALRALVKEINSLTVENGSLDEELSRKVKRIRELEAEREKLKQIANRQGALLFFEEGLKREANLIVECDAIRAKTIEECADVAHSCGYEGAANAIRRALAQTAPALTSSD
jgi:hypothetical protein